MHIANAQYALLFLAIPIVALLFWIARARTLRALNRLADSPMKSFLTRRVSDRKAVLRTASLFGALVLMIAALTQPQMGGHSTLVKKEGIDILFVLDVSKSMAVPDIRPNRLKRARLELQSLIEELTGDRVGIVSFAGAAFVQCPLTTDYAAARMFLKSVSPSDMPVQGTAIAPALELAHKILTGENSNAASRLIVLLTDGEDHGEDLDQAVSRLAEAKIPVFAVGVGSASGEPIPLYDDNGTMTGYLKTADGKTVMSRLNESGLSKIASKTDGKYVNLQAGGSLSELHDFVTRMQKQQFESALYTQYEEKYAWLLWPGFLLLLLATLVDERRNSRWLGLRK